MTSVNIIPEKKELMTARTIERVPEDADALAVEEPEWLGGAGYVLSPFSESPPRS